MKLPLTWLKEFVRVTEKPTIVADIFTSLGFEVEKVESFGGDWAKIVVAKIVSIRPHPNANRLRLATVTDGHAAQEVVCGAPNIAVGQLVPYAREGVVLPNGQKIARLNIRGVESRGMLCSEKELGFGLDHSGILILPTTARVGATLSQALDLAEVVFDLNVPPSRPDCLSVIGLAREYAAYTGRQCLPGRRWPERKTARSQNRASVNIKLADKKLCPLYQAKLINGLTVTESPVWLKTRLLASGLRPINNIVDATNYIMLETGQPLHAFDVDKLASQKEVVTINVRPAANGEEMISLDGVKRRLGSDILVIADGRQPVAIAGVMGGQASQVTPTTKRILLEAAVFQPRSVRRSSQKLGLRSESSTRFEKGLSIEGTETAASAAVRMIITLAGGQVVANTQAKGALTSKKKSIVVKAAELNAILSLKLPVSQIKKYLLRLGCRVSGGSSRLIVTPPDWRPDLVYQADIIEEIGRLYGYNKLEPTLLAGSLRPARSSAEREHVEDLRDIMVRLGYQEVYNYSFYGHDQAGATEISVTEHYRLANPLNADQQYLRTSLWPGLKNVIRKNASLLKGGKIFEIGRVFLPGRDQPQEKNQLGLVIIGPQRLPEKLFRELKGVLEILWTGANNQRLVTKAEGAKYHVMLPDDRRLGYFAILPAAVSQECKVEGLIGYANVDISLLSQDTRLGNYRGYSRYPAIERDLAIVVPEAVAFGSVQEIILDQNTVTVTKVDPVGLIKSVTLFDEIYRGPALGAGKKSMPIRIVFQSGQRTLRREEVEKVIKTIIDKLAKQLQAGVRGASEGNKE